MRELGEYALFCHHLTFAAGGQISWREGGTRRDKTGSRQAGSSTFLFSGGGEEIGKEVNGYRASECNCCSRARRKTSIPPLLSLPIRWIRPTIGNGIKAREDIERMACIRAHARVPRVGARGVWESLRGGASRSPPSMSVRSCRIHRSRTSFIEFFE